MPKKGEETKESLINCEIKRLNKIFGLKGEDAKGFQQELIQNAAFMAVSLREMLPDGKKKDGGDDGDPVLGYISGRGRV